MIANTRVSECQVMEPMMHDKHQAFKYDDRKEKCLVLGGWALSVHFG
jgi:hypothetical protein